MPELMQDYCLEVIRVGRGCGLAEIPIRARAVEASDDVGRRSKLASVVLVSDRVYIKRVASWRAGEVAPKGTRSRLAEDVRVSEVCKSRIDSDWNRGGERFCPDIHGALERCPGRRP